MDPTTAPNPAHTVAMVAFEGHQLLDLAGPADVFTAATLLDGYEATSHWATSDELARPHPEVSVLEDRILVHVRDRWTSAGVTAGIDLALALVEADHGAELAHQVAAWLVVFRRRPGGRSQFSSQLRARPPAARNCATCNGGCRTT